MITDVLGQQVSVGDTVALAKRCGNSAEMVIREVVELEELDYNRKSVKVRAPSGRSGWTGPQNIVVIKKGKNKE